ncbi:DUF202 domain-containing protein [Ancylobacter sonchi]|uniref:DUF202 domain-containing protein n=1 Tax=Ancylobacter sonchi TaxID=1937790 RepID=UPI001BD3993D|nr:DUF202 domain-containing protein [Ancylobacter sonchi]MBS7532514.1 DUF202 domain-containing protein [Ancylobacter sonchi]
MESDNPARAAAHRKDRGLQFERTGLAWLRSGVLAMLLAAVEARRAVATESALHLVSAALLGVLAGFLFFIGRQRGHYPTERGAYAVRELRQAPHCTSLLVIVIATVESAIVLGRLFHH